MLMLCTLGRGGVPCAAHAAQLAATALGTATGGGSRHSGASGHRGSSGGAQSLQLARQLWIDADAGAAGLNHQDLDVDDVEEEDEDEEGYVVADAGAGASTVLQLEGVVEAYSTAVPVYKYSIRVPGISPYQC